jgi:ribosomal RNA-processing protein 17
VELNTTELARQNNWIGQNKPMSNVEHGLDSEAESEIENENVDTIPGMELDQKTVRESDQDIEEEETEGAPKATKSKINLDSIKSKKDINRQIKNQSLKSMKKSKAFKMKERMQRIKNKKKSRRENYKRQKMESRKNKGKPREDSKGNVPKKGGKKRR